MIVLWPDWAIHGLKPDKDFMQSTIGKIEHQRGSISSASKTIVQKDFNDGQPGSVFNHHVPYNRIASRILAICDGETYQKVYDNLRKLLEVFGNEKLSKKLSDLTHFDDPMNSLYNFSQWFNYVFEAICDWPNNLFLGPSSGDNHGRDVDNPLNPSEYLTKRLSNARTTYKNALGIRIDPKDGHDPEVISQWNRSFDY